ncbi:hypothetical protein [Rhodopila sp.]
MIVKTGSTVGVYVLTMVVADETARANWEHLKATNAAANRKAM